MDPSALSNLTTGNSWLDFAGDLNVGADAGLF